MAATMKVRAWITEERCYQDSRGSRERAEGDPLPAGASRAQEGPQGPGLCSPVGWQVSYWREGLTIIILFIIFKNVYLAVRVLAAALVAWMHSLVEVRGLTV